MALISGTRLGCYEIQSPLGAGGMGEVYRARDTKLGRDVALKIIPEAFALDADRVARFKREAQVLASLNDPHIAAIYGFEDSGQTHALVLELVEGDTLAELIARRAADLMTRRAGPSGPAALPLDEALPIARQIAEALEAAHEHGIIHRDLKPANIKITPDGSRLIFSLRVSGPRDIYQKPASGSGQEELLLHAGVNGRPEDWSPDGKSIVYMQTGQTTAADLWLLPLEGDRTPIPYLQTPFDEAWGRFGPGPASGPRWMAYQSNESGQYQIYVQAIPASGAKYQISTSGGTAPMWRRDGKELFYYSTAGKVMAVPITLGTSVTPGTPEELFAIPMSGYVPSADGQRFLVNVPAGGQAAASPVTVVLNWTAGLQK